MREYEIDNNTFIGGWYMPEEVCDSVVDVLNSEQDKLVDGECGRGLNPEWKKCKDLYVPPNNVTNALFVGSTAELQKMLKGKSE